MSGESGMPPETKDGVTKMIAWTLDIVVFPMIFGLGYWVWGTQEAIVIQQQALHVMQSDISRVYDEGTMALKSHLIQEARADGKFEGVQEKIFEISTNQKEMQAKMQEMLLMQRDLLNAIKSNNRDNAPNP